MEPPSIPKLNFELVSFKTQCDKNVYLTSFDALKH